MKVEKDFKDLFLQVELTLNKMNVLLDRLLELENMLKTIEKFIGRSQEEECSFFKMRLSDFLLVLYNEMECILRPFFEKHISRLAQLERVSSKLVYFVLMMTGPKHPSYFWRRLKLHRSTAHYAIKRLMEKGFVTIDNAVVKLTEEELPKSNKC